MCYLHRFTIYNCLIYIMIDFIDSFKGCLILLTIRIVLYSNLKAIELAFLPLTVLTFRILCVEYCTRCSQIPHPLNPQNSIVCICQTLADFRADRIAAAAAAQEEHPGAQSERHQQCEYGSRCGIGEKLLLAR